MKKLFKTNNKIPEDAQSVKEGRVRLDKHYQLNTIGQPSKNVTTYKETTPNIMHKNSLLLYNMSTDSKSRHRHDKNIYVDKEDYSRRRNIFEKETEGTKKLKGNYPSQKLQNVSETDSSICFSIPGESKEKVKIIRKKGQPYGNESKGILAGPSRTAYSRNKRAFKQVSFADFDVVYGTTPENTSSESNETLWNNRFHHYVYQAQDIGNTDTAFMTQSNTISVEKEADTNVTANKDEAQKYLETKTSDIEEQKKVKSLKMNPRNLNKKDLKLDVSLNRKYLLSHNKNSETNICNKSKSPLLVSTIPKPSINYIRSSISSASKERKASLLGKKHSSDLCENNENCIIKGYKNTSGSILNTATAVNSIPEETDLNKRKSVTDSLKESSTLKDISQLNEDKDYEDNSFLPKVHEDNPQSSHITYRDSIEIDSHDKSSLPDRKQETEIDRINEDESRAGKNTKSYNHNVSVSNLNEIISLESNNKSSVELQNVLYIESKEEKEHKLVESQTTATLMNTGEDSLEQVSKDINSTNVSRKSIENSQMYVLPQVIENISKPNTTQDESIASTLQAIPSHTLTNISFESLKREAPYQIDSEVNNAPTIETVQDNPSHIKVYNDPKEKEIQEFSKNIIHSDNENKEDNMNYGNVLLFRGHINDQSPFLNKEVGNKILSESMTENLYEQEGNNKNITFLEPSEISGNEVENISQDYKNNSFEVSTLSNSKQDLIIEASKESSFEGPVLEFEEKTPNKTFNVFYTYGGTTEKRTNDLNVEKNDEHHDSEKIKSSKEDSISLRNGPKGLLIFVNKKTADDTSEFDYTHKYSNSSPIYMEDGQKLSESDNRGKRLFSRKFKGDKDWERHSFDETAGRRYKSGTLNEDDKSYEKEGILHDPNEFPRKGDPSKYQYRKRSSFPRKSEQRDTYSRKPSPRSTLTGAKDGKNITIEQSPSGEKITHKYPCGCLRIITKGPDNELETEEFVSAFCKEGSLCEIQHPKLKKTKRTGEVPGLPLYSSRKRMPGSHTGCLFSNMEILADGIISKKKIPGKPPAPIMRGANLYGSINIKNDKLNGIFNMYFDPRLVKYVLENIEEVQTALREHIQG